MSETSGHQDVGNTLFQNELKDIIGILNFANEHFSSRACVMSSCQFIVLLFGT